MSRRVKNVCLYLFCHHLLEGDAMCWVRFRIIYCHVTLWWCYTTALGTMGDTRHLLGLVSLGTQIEGFEQNREKLNVYHLLSYYLLNHSRCQVPDIKHHMVTTNAPFFSILHQYFNLCASKTIIIMSTHYLY